MVGCAAFVWRRAYATTREPRAAGSTATVSESSGAFVESVGKLLGAAHQHPAPQFTAVSPAPYLSPTQSAAMTSTSGAPVACDSLEAPSHNNLSDSFSSRLESETTW